MMVAGCAPEEMGIGPVYAVPKLLKHHGLKVSDIGLWELNEAFACQAIYCRDHLGIDPEIFNVNGGAIALGHPLGASGARLMTTLMHSLHARGQRYGLQTMCEGGGIANVTIIEAL